VKSTGERIAIRLWVLALVLAAGAGVVFAVSDYVEGIVGVAAEPLKAELSTVPLVLGEYEGKDVEMSEEVAAILDAQDSIKRVYRNDAGDYFTMYVGYFAHLAEARLHSPKVCYPGAGWSQRWERDFISRGAGGEAVPVSVLVFDKSGRYQGVVSWYILWGGPTADAYAAKWAQFRIFMFGRRGIIKVQLAMMLDEEGEIPEERMQDVIVRINSELERLLPDE